MAACTLSPTGSETVMFRNQQAIKVHFLEIDLTLNSILAFSPSAVAFLKSFSIVASLWRHSTREREFEARCFRTELSSFTCPDFTINEIFVCEIYETKQRKCSRRGTYSFTMRFLQLVDHVLDVQQPCRRLGFLEKRMSKIAQESKSSNK